jgi:hypothetical protein
MRVQCRCGNTLGVIAAGQYVMQHRGRQLTVSRSADITIACEECKRTVRIPAEEPAAAILDDGAPLAAA